MNYRLIRGGVNQLSSIEAQVNEHIMGGWEPIGELKSAITDGQTVFIQQMKFVGVVPNEPKRLLNETHKRDTSSEVVDVDGIQITFTNNWETPKIESTDVRRRCWQL